MPQPLPPRPNPHPPRPLVLLGLLVVLIFAAESGIMLALGAHPPPLGLGVVAGGLVDALLLCLIVLPFLYCLFYRPLVARVEEQHRTELELRRLGEELERRVAERTAELEQVNRRLRVEALERKNTLEELHYSEQKYATLVESSPVGIFIQREGRVVFANQRLAELLGRSRGELVGSDPGRFVHPEDWPWVEAIMVRRMRGEEVPDEYETRVVTRAGETRWVLLRAVRVDYRGGPSTLGTVVDLTPRKRAEAALEESERGLRELSSRLLTAQEDERAHIARNLHDGIGQSLTAIKFALESALRRPAPDRSLAELVPRLQELVTEVRRISQGLHPSILDDLGLVRTLHWQGREFEGLCPGLEVAVACRVEEGDVPAPLKIVVFRIVQEALSNAAKHSGASRVEVTLEADDGELRLAVADDGRGLPARPPEQARTGEGFGINSMRERATLSGGRFALRTAPDAGTAVHAAWPLAACPTE